MVCAKFEKDQATEFEVIKEKKLKTFEFYMNMTFGGVSFIATATRSPNDTV